jgi:iron complex outermembrane receptor protein
MTIVCRRYNSPKTSRLLVLVNGRQIYNDGYNEVNWLAIPVQLEETRQIVIVKGPSAALFGFNAVSGVVNIITFSPFYDDVDTASVSFENSGSYQAVSACRRLVLAS